MLPFSPVPRASLRCVGLPVSRYRRERLRPQTRAHDTPQRSALPCAQPLPVFRSAQNGSCAPPPAGGCGTLCAPFSLCSKSVPLRVSWSSFRACAPPFLAAQTLGLQTGFFVLRAFLLCASCLPSLRFLRPALCKREVAHHHGGAMGSSARPAMRSSACAGGTTKGGAEPAAERGTNRGLRGGAAAAATLRSPKAGKKGERSERRKQGEGLGAKGGGEAGGGGGEAGGEGRRASPRLIWRFLCLLLCFIWCLSLPPLLWCFWCFLWCLSLPPLLWCFWCFLWCLSLPPLLWCFWCCSFGSSPFWWFWRLACRQFQHF